MLTELLLHPQGQSGGGSVAESRRRRLGHHSDSGRGMTLPFQPLNMAFSHMYYSVDMPPVRAYLILGDSMHCTFHSDRYMHVCIVLQQTCD